MKINTLLSFLLLALLAFSSGAYAYKDVSVSIANITKVANSSPVIVNITMNVSNSGTEVLNDVDVNLSVNGNSYGSMNTPELDISQGFVKEFLVTLERSSMTHEILVGAEFNNSFDDDEFPLDNFDTATVYVWWGGINLVATAEALGDALVNESAKIQIYVENSGLWNATNVSVVLTANGESVFSSVVPLLESIYYNNKSRIQRTVQWTPREQIPYTLVLNITNGDASVPEYYESDNIAEINITPVTPVETRFFFVGVVDNIAMGVKGNYEPPNVLSSFNVLLMDPRPQEMSILQTETLDEIFFENSTPEKNMNLKFAELGNKFEGGKQFYGVYAFKPSWDYSGFKVEFNEYPEIGGLVVFGCREWDWTSSKCAAAWEALNTTGGSIIGVSSVALEAVALAQGWLCGNGACESHMGESNANCPQDCASQTITNVVGGGGGGSVTVNLSEEEKADVGVTVTHKTETASECSTEGSKNCMANNLNVCKNGSIVTYKCLYGCTTGRCIEVGIPTINMAEAVVLLVVVGILATGVVVSYLHWRSNCKRKKRKTEEYV